MLYTELQKIEKTLQQFPFPKKITFEVCAICNLRCVMCYRNDMNRQKGVMPFELWKKCADELALTSPETDCWFSGAGDPLLEPDLLCRMLSYGKSVGLKSLNMNTNGMLMSSDIADRILDTGVDVVVFGVDGYTKSVYESIRVGGDRDKVFANIESFLAARASRTEGPDIQVQFIEMDENEHELEEFKNYWLNKGAVVKVRRKLSWGGRVETPTNIPLDQRIPCPWVINLMHIFWDGRIPRCPCANDDDKCVGNAWEDSVSELWSRLSPHRQLHLDRNFNKLPGSCNKCKDWMTGASEKNRPAGQTQSSSDHKTGI